MQISKRRVNSALEKQVNHIWYQLIADTKTVADAQKIFGDLLSWTEAQAITKRLAIAYWLAKKRSYENIKENLKVSSATIATIAQELKKPGWQLALQKIMSEEWSTKWEEKIKNAIMRRK